MANSVASGRSAADLHAAARLAGLSLVLGRASLVAVAVLALADPAQATSEAWGHAIVVAALAALLPLRVRGARRGEARALRAARLVAAIVLVVNVVEAALPGTFPGWMRVEMVAAAVVMALLLRLLVRAGHHGDRAPAHP